MTDDFMDDLESDASSIKATAEQLSDVGALATKMRSLQEEIDALDAQMQLRQKELREIEEKQLPEIFDAANISEFTTGDGVKLKLKEDVRASISEPNKPVAFAWLREHGHGDLIKRQLIIELGRGKDNVAEAIVARVKEEFDIEPEDKASVHASTLSAFCREQLEAGVELPAGPLGLFTRRFVALPKRRK